MAVIEPSGSRKNTLLRYLTLLETPDRGRVYLENQLFGYVARQDGTLLRDSEREHQSDAV